MVLLPFVCEYPGCRKLVMSSELPDQWRHIRCRYPQCLGHIICSEHPDFAADGVVEQNDLGCTEEIGGRKWRAENDIPYTVMRRDIPESD